MTCNSIGFFPGHRSRVGTWHSDMKSVFCSNWGIAGVFLARFGGSCGVPNINALNMFDNRSRGFILHCSIVTVIS